MSKKNTLLAGFIFTVLLIGVILFGGRLFNRQIPIVQPEISEFFPETGHWVIGPFFDYYTDTENAKVLFGLPITDEFINELTGRKVQYFENVRFEHHPENPIDSQVVLTKLGEVLYNPDQQNDPDPFTINCRLANDWSHQVCFSFLDFYEANGGEARIGRPISGLERSKGRFVQYFEYAQMIWTPDHPEGAQVSLARLGKQYFYAYEKDFSKLEPIRNSEYTMSISKLQVRAFTQHAMVSPNDNQTVYVTVGDQNSAPVIGARVTTTVEYPNNQSETFVTIATDNNGLAQGSFQVISERIGLVNLTIFVEYGEVELTTTTSFRIWY